MTVNSVATVPGCVYLSVNVSPATAVTGELYDLIVAGAVQADRVVLELTEHTGVADYAALRAALGRLRQLGVRIEVDDAGSGFASLRHILQIEPAFVKLDLDRVCNIDRDPARRALAVGLLTFTDQIGATLVGEGIENERELAALLEVGVPLWAGLPPRPTRAVSPTSLRVGAPQSGDLHGSSHPMTRDRRGEDRRRWTGGRHPGMTERMIDLRPGRSGDRRRELRRAHR